MSKQRMRRGEPAPRPDAVALRGGALDADLLRRDAEVNHAVYGFYGLLMWIPKDHDHEQVLLATKLLKSRVVQRFEVAGLTAHDLEVWDTGQPPHYDVVYAAGSLDRLIQTILAAPHTTLINPHHDPDGGPDR